VFDRCAVGTNAYLSHADTLQAFVLTKCVNGMLYGIGGKEVVMIQGDDVLASRDSNAGIARYLCSTVVLVPYDGDSPVAIGIFPNDVCCAIVADIVDKDELEGIVTLVQYRLDALPYVFLHVVDGNDDADKRLILHS
jgi:hypothetical protein